MSSDLKKDPLVDPNRLETCHTTIMSVTATKTAAYAKDHIRKYSTFRY